MNKKQALKHWASLKPNQTILDKMHPLPYKTRGSAFGTDGIRIDGSPEFVDAVLSRLQDLLAGENALTRLGFSYTPIAPREDRVTNALPGAVSCYIRLHERGLESTMAMALDRDAMERAERYVAMVEGARCELKKRRRK